jgi:hypothetical protein
MPRHIAESDDSASHDSSALFGARERMTDRRRFIIVGSGMVLGSWAAPNLQSFAAASAIASGVASTTSSTGPLTTTTTWMWSDPANILLNSSFEDGGLGTTIPNWVLA